MHSVPRRFWMRALVPLALAAFIVPVYAGKEFAPPRAFDAKTYPARDEHPEEKVTIAADPYDMGDKAAIFRLKYGEAGFLPVHLIISNTGDEPVSLTDLRVQFVTVGRDKITPADRDDLFRRFSRISRRGDEPRRSPIPLPGPSGPKVGVDKDTRNEIEAAMFQAKAVEPHATQAGFLFFDISGIHQPLAGAHIYVMGVKNAAGSDLMFFDIPLEKYLSYRP